MVRDEYDALGAITRRYIEDRKRYMDAEAWRVLRNVMGRSETGREPFVLDPEGEVKVNTGRAILVSLQNGTVEKWIPLSCLHCNNMTFGVGDTGKIVVFRWWAKRNGYYTKED